MVTKMFGVTDLIRKFFGKKQENQQTLEKVIRKSDRKGLSLVTLVFLRKDNVRLYLSLAPMKKEDIDELTLYVGSSLQKALLDSHKMTLALTFVTPDEKTKTNLITDKTYQDFTYYDVRTIPNGYVLESCKWEHDWD